MSLLFLSLAIPALPFAQSLASDDLAALGVARADVQRLDVAATPGEPFSLSLRLGGEFVLLELEPHSVRAPGFTVLVQDESGALLPASAPPVTNWRGRLTGHPDAFVAASVVDGRLSAVVRRSAGEPMWGVQPLAPTIGGARFDEYAVYSATDLLPHDGVCGIQEVLRSDLLDTSGAGEGGVDTSVQVALDTDVGFFQANGSSVDATVADVLSVQNAVDAIYQSEAGISSLVTAVVVRTAEPDPYSGTNPDNLLAQVQQEWSTNLAGIPRDLVQLHTDTTMTFLFFTVIGVAEIDSVCSQAEGANVSNTTFFPDLLSRAGLSAHEFGHNWSALHCDGDPDCAIMCSGIGGCTGNLTTFGASGDASIAAIKASAPCLSPAGACGVETYGESVGNTLELSVSGPIQPGTQITFEYASPPSAGAAARTFIATTPDSNALPAGTALIRLDTVLASTSGVTFGSLLDTPQESVTLPSSPALVGQFFFLQAAAFDPGVSAVSNGVIVTFCP